jgi:TorA maturation chaperone TorD
MTTVAVDPGIRLAALWRLLSLGFGAPTDETMREVRALADVLAELPEPPPELLDLIEILDAVEIEQLAADQQSLFGGKVRVAPYEGSYEVDPIRQGRQMADVAAFYRAFGASAHGPAAERPDHAGCELEFLAFLELRRRAAVETGDVDGAALLDEIAAAFLEDHAGRWLPTFFTDVQAETAPASVHHVLAALGNTALGAELERRGLDPSPPPRRPQRTSVERDSFDCGGAIGS